MMTSTASDHSEEEDHEDTDSQELFESFMQITKHQEILESEANGIAELKSLLSETKRERESENLQCESNRSAESHNLQSEAKGATKFENLKIEANGAAEVEKPQSETNDSAEVGNLQSKVIGAADGAAGVNNLQSEVDGAVNAKDLRSKENEVAEVENINQINADVVEKESAVQSIVYVSDQHRKDSNTSDNTHHPSEEQNITKRLSKAVDELSDLEKQLSLMISGALSCSSPPEQVNNKTDGSTPQSEQDESLSSLGDVNCSTETKTDLYSDNEKNVRINSSYKANKVDASSNDNNDCNEATNPSETIPSESSLHFNETTKIELDKTEVHNENKIANETEVEINSITDNTETRVVKDGNESGEKINLDIRGLENPIEESDKVSRSIFVAKHPESPTENNLNIQINGGTVNTLENDDSLKASFQTYGIQPRIDKDNESVGKTSEEDDGVQSCTLNKDLQADMAELVITRAEEANHENAPPEIKILMTDESGNSERKSLESLDAELECEVRPDSPALPDEEVESDARSMDGSDDDDDDTPFGSTSDLTNKDGHLRVERNRYGSNSSTISEKEFRYSGIFKDDKDSPGKVLIKGYLMKLGGSGLTRKWRKRWFVLKEDNCLYYYKHSKDKVPCGVIILCNYSVTKAPDSNKNYCFKLNKGGARTYHLSAGDDSDMKEWMLTLMKAASAVLASGSSFQLSEGSVHNVSIPALSIKDPDCHGYLSKQGQGIKTWKRRYCVLKNGYLYYYSDMSNTTALGVAKLLGYHIKCGVSRGKLFCFYGSPPDESMRVYHFAAETENDRERWMKRMEESIVRGNSSS